MSGPCCSPQPLQPESRETAATTDAGPTLMASLPRLRMVALSGGRFRMGSEDGIFPADGEGPMREVTLSPFSISAHAVTNEQFAAFVNATGYRTDAERAGSSFVFADFMDPDALGDVRGRVVGTPWWADVTGASWRAPEGPGSSIDGRLDHPVVHVSHRDALAFCGALGSRLPTEAEWEFAARGGLDQKRYPWGDELRPGGRWRCNVWQGSFPEYDSGEDGYRGTAPVDVFAPNSYGLHNMVGNVWEWCSDWFSPRPPADPQRDPTGPVAGSTLVIRGGSYLCHDSYCFRYRVAARSSNTPDSSIGHTGFRVVRSLID
jgi:formylglycine-generating enzyme